jgi:FeS assembly SUF system protein
MMDNKDLSDFMPKANTEGEMIYGDISTSSDIKVEVNLIIEKLIQIKDPELGINIYDLGLIYDVKIDEFNNVKILMTLTTVNCPVADSFPLEVAKKTSEIEGVGQVAVKLTFEPTWNKDMMSEDARLALGY